MIGAASIVGIVMVLGALVLAVSGLRSHGLSFKRTAGMALVWLLIFLVLLLVIRMFAA